MTKINKLLYIFGIILMILSLIYPKESYEIDTISMNKNNNILIDNFKVDYNKYLSLNFYEGESVEIISNKINRYLNSSIKNKGKFITEYSLKVGVNPYLSASVILHETGCQWTCSYLARVCNNYGGNKGKPSCNGGSYRRFSSTEEGLTFAIDKLSSYYKKGLKTPEQINKSYATSKTWASKINNYMKKLKSN